MKNVLKKIGTAFTGLALALCLTACNNGGTSSGNTSVTSTVQNNSTASGTSTASSAVSSATSSSSEESSVLESSSESSSKPTESVTETSAPTETSIPVSEPASEPTDEGKTLVVYFTWSSNTAGMAEIIAGLTGADTFEIVPVTPYPEEYTPCTEVALEERDNNARPAIQNLPSSVSEYDNIIIGYPI